MQILQVEEVSFFIIFSVFFRQLLSGTLQENRIRDGSTVLLIPNVETGLLVSTIKLSSNTIYYLNLYMCYVLYRPKGQKIQ